MLLTSIYRSKIIFCDNSLRELINFRGEIINDYARNGHKVILIAPINSDYSLKEPNIRIIPIEINRSGMNPFSDLKYFLKLLAIYRREKPDYIFHYTIKPNIYGSIAAKISKTPSTAMIAGLGYVFTDNSLGSKIARFLYRFSMRFPEKVLILNKYNREVLIEKKIASDEKIILLKGGEGVDLTKFN